MPKRFSPPIADHMTVCSEHHKQFLGAGRVRTRPRSRSPASRASTCFASFCRPPAGPGGYRHLNHGGCSCRTSCSTPTTRARGRASSAWALACTRETEQSLLESSPQGGLAGAGQSRIPSSPRSATCAAPHARRRRAPGSGAIAWSSSIPSPTCALLLLDPGRCRRGLSVDGDARGHGGRVWPTLYTAWDAEVRRLSVGANPFRAVGRRHRRRDERR